MIFVFLSFLVLGFCYSEETSKDDNLIHAEGFKTKVVTAIATSRAKGAAELLAEGTAEGKGKAKDKANGKPVAMSGGNSIAGEPAGIFLKKATHDLVTHEWA